MKNEFEEMYGKNTDKEEDYNLDNKDVAEETEEKPQKTSNETEMKPGDVSNFTYIKIPDVGQEIELEIKKVIKKPARQIARDGDSFWTGLEDKNGKKEETILETTTGERLGLTSWGLYFALFGKESKFQELANKQGTYEGIKLRIKHVYNGKDASTKLPDLMKLRDFKTEEEAEKHKETVRKAIKEGMIYTVEILN